MSKSKGNKIVQGIASVMGRIASALVVNSMGIIGSSAIGQIVKEGTEEVLSRLISRRQAERIHEGRDYILMRIKSKLDEQYVVQNPMFQIENRAEADEILEGVLLKVMNEHEQKKAQYIANLYVNLPFERDIDIADANQILKDVDSLTYRDLCIIALWGRKTEFADSLPATRFKDQGGDRLLLLMRRILKLDEMGIMQRVHKEGQFLLNTPHSVIPYDTKLTTYGEKIFTLFELSMIPTAEIEPIFSQINLIY